MATGTSRADFANELTPCLSLASGVGMSAEDRREWLNAAYRAIGHYPLDLLQRGAAEALKTADHPSKIIPAITAEVEPVIARRRESAARAARWTEPLALPAPGGERCTRAELDAICKQHGVGRYARAAGADRSSALPGASADPDRPCRAPTRADYLRLGVTADVLDSMGIA